MWPLNSTAPVSFVGMYGLSAGVLAPGPGHGRPRLASFRNPSASGLGNGIDSLRSIARTDGDFAMLSTFPTGTVALM